MNQILTINNHSKEPFILASSKSLERAAFYGVRSLLILYMVSETIDMSDKDALDVYSWFSGSLLISKVIGGLFGDLFIGNRRAVILGGLVHAIRAFVLCINSHLSLYIGVGLISLGSGIYYPNLLAQFGKYYREKTNLQDAGFMILFMSISIGTVIGTTLIGYISYQSFTYGFVSAGILGLFSVFVFIKSGKPHLVEFETKKRNTNPKHLFILSIITLTIIFWGVSEWTGQDLLSIQQEIATNHSNIDLPENSWPSSISSTFAFILGIVACIVWTYNYSRQLVKLILGFLFASLSIAIVIIVKEVQSDNSFLVIIFAMFMMALAETFVKPVTHSVIAKYGDIKYLAIAFSLAVVPWHFLPILTANLYSGDSFPVLIIGSLVFFLVAIGIITFKLIKKKTYNIL
ncbi:MAG: POT family proton-dependent oligopeptide transporter [Cyclobacteriaceae bacterium]|jgi:POT family proton-dependent oligopeptide transporter